MECPANCVYIVQGELNLMITALRRNSRWLYHNQHEEEQDPLVSSFIKLKQLLNTVSLLRELDTPNDFLSPFLEVVRSEETTGPITAMALGSINKFISYSFIDTKNKDQQLVSATIDNIADAVTHARFVGTDPSSDEVVLMKILHVLRTLLMSKAGDLLTNESVCEIMQSCFRICFEMRLSELLRRSAENTLMDMVRVLFCRLPEFEEDAKWHTNMRKLKMRCGDQPSHKMSASSSGGGAAGGHHHHQKKRSPRLKTPKSRPSAVVEPVTKPKESPVNDSEVEAMATSAESLEHTSSSQEVIGSTPVEGSTGLVDIQQSFQAANDAKLADNAETVDNGEEQATPEDYVSSRGIRFTSQHKGPLLSYGLPCIRELFRFIVSLTNPHDRHNTDIMMHIGISLLTVAMETGADNLADFSSLLHLIKDDMCRHLFFLLQCERLTLFAASIRVCFLMFECLRKNLKFQLEMYIEKLMSVVIVETARVSYEQREIALDTIVQLLRIPGLVGELYLNYDCKLYSSCLFEELTKMLSKNAFPVSGIYTTHLLSLEALLAIIEGIESHCRHLTNDNEDNIELKKSFKGTFTEESSLSENIEIEIVPDNRLRNNRMKVTESVPCDEHINNIRNKKKSNQASEIKQYEKIKEDIRERIYTSGTEIFNQKPSKGIAYLQQHHLLEDNAESIASFLRENPRLDKKQIGEYVSARKNEPILLAFLKAFNFANSRIDESLRRLLESFRLPGEAPVIQYLLEHFAEIWTSTNGNPFVNVDAAFTLAYAVIILNVDQHNQNAKKQNVPMTVVEFKKNVKGVNGGVDFDQDMLESIYTGIKNNEIVMPSEQTGLVKDNYLWKMLLARGDSEYQYVAPGTLDRALFSLVWGSVVAALSYVLSYSSDESIIHKAITGYRKCAVISAYYEMSDVFDNLIISLCKFTTLVSSTESAESLPIILGNNVKARLAARTVFTLTNRHADILRDGWKNILDCLLQLYRANLLPEFLVEVEDFLSPDGKISLVRTETQTATRNDSSVLSSFYFYFTTSTDSSANKSAANGASSDDRRAAARARDCIDACHIDQLVTDSRFLRAESLAELIKALLVVSGCPELQQTMNGCLGDEDSAVFFLELLFRLILQNRDRIGQFWPDVRDHIEGIVTASLPHRSRSMLVERAVVGLLRLSIRLLRRDDLASEVLSSLNILLNMSPQTLNHVCVHISYGVHELLKTNAANIHSSKDWYTLFTLIEVVGAGVNPPNYVEPSTTETSEYATGDAQSDSEIYTVSAVATDIDRGYTSDGDIGKSASGGLTDRSGSWLLVNGQLNTQFTMVDDCKSINQPNVKALLKSAETLSFLVRDAAHITPHNFTFCVHTIRTFIEANIVLGNQQALLDNGPVTTTGGRNKKMKKSHSSPSHLQRLDDNSDTDDLNDSASNDHLDHYHSLAIQLLDLMHTLHTRAAIIFTSWATEEKKRLQAAASVTSNPSEGVDFTSITIENEEECCRSDANSLWTQCWCPLLQGIARLCCDRRRHVRSQALTYLQRSLLVHDLQTLPAVEWESCFNKVLFPLLSRLLEPINPTDITGVEETRMRASTTLCKVFLQHLTPLLTLSTFTALWLTILDFMDRYMHLDDSELLCEAIPESLKNMLLVMNTAGILVNDENSESHIQFWRLTWDRINQFIPTLHDDVFKPTIAEENPTSLTSNVRPTISSETVSSTAATPAGIPPSSPPPPEQPLINTQVLAPTPCTPATAAQEQETTPPAALPTTVDTLPADFLATTPGGLDTGSNTQQYFLHTPLPSATLSANSTPLVLDLSIVNSAPLEKHDI